MHTLDVITKYKASLSSIVPPDNVATDDAVLNEYSRDHSLVQPTRPFLVVFPENQTQVKAIVTLSNEMRVPLVPVSSGTPRFHGDTVPGQSGAVINFSRMNHVIKIDALNRCVMIEPGVTYGELLPEVVKHGLKLNIPLLPRASKSVLTNYLERQPVLIPKYQYDYMDPLLTLGVVYGTGNEMRTGSASGPGDLDSLKSDKVNPWGPGSVDFYRLVSAAQGTMGLVTWAMVKAEVLPSLQKTVFINTENAGIATTLMNNLLFKRVVDECLALNNVNLATILAESWPGDYRELTGGLPPWTVIVSIAGYKRRPEERVAIQERYLFDICKTLGLTPRTGLPGAGGKEKTIYKLLTNAWEKDPYWKLRRRGSCHDIFFLTPGSKIAEYIKLMNNIASKYRYPFEDIGCYIQPMVQGRGYQCEFSLPYDASDARETAKVRSLFLEASQTFINNGAFFSRPYGPWAGMVYSRYPDGVAALKKLKSIFDPNNILNPGKLCF